MTGVTFNKLPIKHSAKGDTLEWCKGITGTQVTFYYRGRGATFAEHFHKGEDLSKKPERFLLLMGKIRMKFWNGEEEETVDVESGTEMLIQPFIYHEAQALEDSLFAEYRTSPYNKSASDVYTKEQFIEYLAQQSAS